ncbi:3-hydroxyacyl-CoA dehydrogenase [Rhizobium sp. PP-F2F-G48]|uniref:3-hydroxyacyl-CoA dehydrogenase n=1 Tax=Rhizobium sp. PP-F2F-G48 TaxID=2135651 RepID=UPI0010E3F878|nr:3-hydroxyacyl-CoA dehydrogenase [Rhizobium sp. PP-F2F-G48]TCM57217.1 3-hydroxyacyl-CoA dehydrogenase [Rhizobium sp. PP-F2F-G48]
MENTTIKRILIAGSGQVGSEIGFYFAARGLDVVMYDVSQGSLESSHERHGQFATALAAEGWWGTVSPAETLSRLTYETDLAKAAVDVDLVSESVTEAIDVKRKTYEGLSIHCPAKTIFTSNTSTMLPSQIAAFTDRPERFLACHVARPIWARPMFEIMPHPGTDAGLVDEIVAFSRRMGLVPILIAKEHAAYISNSLIASFVTTGLDLVARGVASFEDVDRVWMIGTAMEMGPIGMVDMMGIGTVYNALSHMAEHGGRTELLPIVTYLKENFVDQGKLGVASGQGFYRYPDPAFRHAEFLK